MSDDENAFEIPASTLVDLLASTIPLASTDITLPAINCVMLHRRGDWLTATATDRYIAGIMRARLTPDLPAPEPDWSFPLGLADAKELLKLARSKRRDRLARVRFVDHGLGTLSMPDAGRTFTEFGVRADLRPQGFPAMRTLLRLSLGGLRSTPSGVSGIDPRKLAQFAPAAKVAWDRCEGITRWWETGDRGSDEARQWALRIGEDFVGLVMGIRLPEEQREADLLPAATLADWSEVLR